MKKILFLLLLIPSFAFSQLRLPYSFLLQNYHGDTIKQYFSGDSAKWYTNKPFFSLNKPLVIQGHLVGSSGTESDPIFNASVAKNIKDTDTTRWAQNGSLSLINWNALDTVISIKSSGTVPAIKIATTGNVSHAIKINTSGNNSYGNYINTSGKDAYGNYIITTGSRSIPIKATSSTCDTLISLQKSGITKFEVDGSGNVDITGQYKLSALNTAPSSATDTGKLGEIRITATYIYVCTATNTWVRTALTTW